VTCASRGRYPPARSEAAHVGGRDAQRLGIFSRERLRAEVQPRDEIPILRDIAGVPLGGRIVRAQARLTRENDDVFALRIAIEVQRDAGIALDVLQALRSSLAIDEEASAIPKEPDAVVFSTSVSDKCALSALASSWLVPASSSASTIYSIMASRAAMPYSLGTSTPAASALSSVKYTT